VRRVALDLSVLDALRGLAALYVVIFHARWLLMWPDLTVGGSGFGNRVINLLWDAARFGHPPVLLFFLISGFCIHYRQAKLLAKQPRAHGSGMVTLNLRAFAWRRLRRLYPPLLVALAITALLDQAGARVNPAYYAGQSQYDGINAFLISTDSSLWTLLGNMALQANLAFPIFGTDIPLWTLSIEFWFYALYPLVLVLSTRFGPRAMLAVTGVVSAVGLAAVLRDGTWNGGCVGVCTWAWIPAVLTYWAVWAGGAFIAEAYVGRIRLARLSSLAAVAVVLVGLNSANYLHPIIRVDELVTDLAWGVGFAVLLAWAMLDCPPALARLIGQLARWLTPLGNMSYSLYLVHMPVLFLLSAWWLSSHHALPAGLELAAVGVTVSLGLAGLCWYCVERYFVSPRSGIPLALHRPIDENLGRVEVMTPVS